MTKCKVSILSISIMGAISQLVLAQEKIELDPIFVSTARDASPLTKLANNATVIRAERLEKNLQNNIKDALDDVAGVSFDSKGRFGLQDVSIRGISGNRVKILMDGQPIANHFSFGPYQSAGRQYIDLNNIDQLEVIKGPASSLHGSDAIGGVVSLVSKTPDAYLKDEQTIGGSIFSKYSGKDHSVVNGATVAFAPSQQFDGLISYTYEYGEETKNFGDGLNVEGNKRTAPNPSKDKANSLQTQLRFKLPENQIITFAANYYHLKNNVNVLSGYGQQAFVPYSYNQYLTDDTQQRTSLSLRHDFTLNNVVIDSGFWKLYHQKQESIQKTFMNGKFINPQNKQEFNAKRSRDNRYSVSDAGFEAELIKRFDGLISHEVMYGISLENRKVNMSQNGLDDLTIRQTPTSSKNAPDSTIRQLGLFVQDRAQLANTGLTFIGGARYDHHRLKTHPDAAFYKSAGEHFKVKNFSKGELSLRFGTLYDLNNNHTLFFNYAEGFRAPGFNETNLGFANYQQGYAYVANPDLKPEKSRGFEIGWRSDNGFIQHDLDIFYTRYNDFIEIQTSIGKNPQTNLTEFTSINLPRTYIYGVELSFNADFGAIDPNLSGLSANLSTAYARGKDKTSGEPLVSISPLSGHLSINYNQNQWGMGAKLNFSKGKSARDIPESQRAPQNPRIPAILPTAGFSTLDLNAYYKPLQNLTIRTGVFNVLDKKYITWSNANGHTALERELYSAAGRWFGASFKYDF